MNITSVLEEKGWCKGQYRKSTGEVCLAGALTELKKNKILNDTSYSVAYKRIVSVAQRLFPERSYFVAVSAVNDHPETSYEDVMLIAKHVDAELIEPTANS